MHGPFVAVVGVVRFAAGRYVLFLVVPDYPAGDDALLVAACCSDEAARHPAVLFEYFCSYPIHQRISVLVEMVDSTEN